MTQRGERWLIVGACVVLYAVAMFLLSWAIREPTKWVVDSLIASVGLAGTALVVALPIIAVGIWAYWPEPSYVPPPSPMSRMPRWARVLSYVYLSATAVCVVVAMGAIVFSSMSK